MLTVGACSTMVLQKYPAPNMNKFEAGKEVEGVSAFAQAILDEKEGEQYFGVNLIEKEILAIYLSVKNQHSSTTFILPAESVHITEIEKDPPSVMDPGRDSKKAGEALSWAGAALLGPLLLAAGVQQLSDSTIIKENFEANRFQSTTLEPGEEASGFLYFQWKEFKNRDKANLCFDLVNPMRAQLSSFCLSVDVKLKRQENG